MKATLACLGALVIGACAAADAAQYYYPPQPCYPARVAPDMCGPGMYCTDGRTWFGPSYYVYPPFPPVGGLPPMIQSSGFPTNPWMRSPRDFYMWGEAQKEKHTRETRPPFGPYWGGGFGGN